MININGITIENVSGKNISIVNGKVIVDGKDVTPDSKNITIEITGDVGKLEVDVCKTINITGNVDMLSSSFGDITCKDVTGNITSSSGNIKADRVANGANSSSGRIEIKGDLTGNAVSSSGNISVTGNINGNVRTVSGDIKS